MKDEYEKDEMMMHIAYTDLCMCLNIKCRSKCLVVALQ